MERHRDILPTLLLKVFMVMDHGVSDIGLLTFSPQAETWEQQGDIKDVISLSKLVKKDDGPDEIAKIIKTLAKYGSCYQV